MWVRSRLWYFLSLLDGASVREAHCEQASTAGYCSAFSDIWKFEVEIFVRDQQRIFLWN